tara:strand:+ start:19075 stop:19617 length:543 start_codon:yes stop_codon:yes gene_type:complete
MKVLDENVERKGKFLELVSRQYSDTQGNIKKWEYVRRPNDQRAVIIVTNVDDKLVVIKEFKVTLDDYEYGFPAGLIDEGESPEDAARRELKEETGLEITEIYSVSPPIYSSAGLTDEAVYMVFCDATGEPTQEFNEGSEDIETHLMDYESVHDLIKTPDVKIGSKAYLSMLLYLRDVRSL